MVTWDLTEYLYKAEPGADVQAGKALQREEGWEDRAGNRVIHQKARNRGESQQISKGEAQRHQRLAHSLEGTANSEQLLETLSTAPWMKAVPFL